MSPFAYIILYNKRTILVYGVFCIRRYTKERQLARFIEKACDTVFGVAGQEVHVTHW